MNELQIFNNAEFGEIRTTEIDGKIYFCGADVAKALGYTNTSKALKDHCKGVTKCYTLTNGGMQQMSFISKGDIFRLAANSKLPDAERFESWIFDEVLPTIETHGAYMTPQTLEQVLLNPDTLIQLAQNLKAEQERNKQLTAKIELDAPKVEFYDAVTDSKTAIPMGQVAKVLNYKGYGRNNLFEFLRDKKVLMQNNMPYQKYIDCEYFRVIEQKYTKPDGEIAISIKTLVYQKGVDYIKKLLDKENPPTE